MSGGSPTSYAHEWHNQRIRFATGEGPAAVASEVELAGFRRILLVASERENALAARVCATVPIVARFSDVVMHVPAVVAEHARSIASQHRVDAVLCVGGGSATGVAKAVALTSGLPIVAVPTTYAGSEATAVWGLTDTGGKRTGTDQRVLPRIVVYDAALTTSLPTELSVTSGLNALAHCVDSLWAPRANPINHVLALDAARQLATGLPRIVTDPHDLSARERILTGAYLAGLTFASAGSGLHHRICHVLGGALDLPHSPTHAVVLPHVLQFNAPYLPEIDRELANAWGGPHALHGLMDLHTSLGAPRSLRELGMRHEDLPRVAELATQAAHGLANPAPVNPLALFDLIEAAWEGAPRP